MIAFVWTSLATCVLAMALNLICLARGSSNAPIKVLGVVIQMGWSAWAAYLLMNQ